MSWKLSSTVLRGGANGNVGSPLGKRNGKGKQPYCFEVGECEPFAFAGLWDRWRTPDGNLAADLHNSDNDAQSAPGGSSRQDAGHSLARGL